MLFDYSREPHSDIAFVDMKSFYASCECVRLGLKDVYKRQSLPSSAFAKSFVSPNVERQIEHQEAQNLR